MIIDDLKIDNSMKIFFTNCIDNDDFPNILLYGNPGTGKTTTTRVLIESYFNSKREFSIQDQKKNVLTLNASVYRNTNEFLATVKAFAESRSTASSKTFKCFVLLDEIDYMTVQGQRSLIVLMKKFDNVVFICMCNYLSKLVEELNSYFLMFNYNCFGSLVGQYIKEQNNDTMETILKYILCDSDIREYVNEKRRLSFLDNTTTNTICNFLKNTVDTLYTAIHERNAIKEFSDIDNQTLTKVARLTGIQDDRLKSIIYQNVFERLTEDDYDKCNIDDIIRFIETVL